MYNKLPGLSVDNSFSENGNEQLDEIFNLKQKVKELEKALASSLRN